MFVWYADCFGLSTKLLVLVSKTVGADWGKMMNEIVIWSGWVAGIAIGLYMLAQHWVTGKQLGCSRSYCSLCAPATRLSFFKNPEFSMSGWRIWFFIGIPLGGLLAVLTSPGAEWQATLSMGALYDSVMPESLWLKSLVLFAGGIMMGVGARMAGGCTSGHVIAGVPSLNLPSMLAGALFFAGGLLAVQLMFGFFA
jgi:uncharacterized membrane protein YedE/YeeE